MRLTFRFNICETSGSQMRTHDSNKFRHCEVCPENNVNCLYKRCVRCSCPVVLTYDNKETCEGCKDDHTISSDKCCICGNSVNLTESIKVIVPKVTKPTEYTIKSIETPNGHAHFTCYYGTMDLDQKTHDLNFSFDLDHMNMYNRFTPYSKKFDESRD